MSGSNEYINCPRCNYRNPPGSDCANCGLQDIKSEKEINQILRARILELESERDQFKRKANNLKTQLEGIARNIINQFPDMDLS